MPIGTSIKKQRWHLDYEKSGYRVDDFSIYFYALVIGGASGCLIWSLLSWRDQKLVGKIIFFDTVSIGGDHARHPPLLPQKPSRRLQLIPTASILTADTD